MAENYEITIVSKSSIQTRTGSAKGLSAAILQRLEGLDASQAVKVKCKSVSEATNLRRMCKGRGFDATVRRLEKDVFLYVSAKEANG